MKKYIKKGKNGYTELVLVFLLLFLSFISLAQNISVGLPFVKNYQKSDYAAGTQNWSITQDKQGIMYFGNNEGMLAFDGAIWRKYQLPNKTVVRALTISNNDRIYAGGQGEFGFFCPDRKGQLTYHSLLDKIPKSDRNFEDVWRIIATPEGIFFNTFKAIFQYKNDTITVFEPQKKFDYIFKAHGEIFASDLTHGLLKFDGIGFKPIAKTPILKAAEIISVLEGDDEEILIITRNSGLFKYNGLLAPWDTKINDTFKNSGAYSAIKLKNGNYAIGTSTDGLIIIDKKGALVLHLSKGRGFNDRTVLSLFEDQSQNLWAGLGNGIAYIETNSPLTLIDEKLGVLGTGYSAVIKDSILYVGTNQAVFKANIQRSKTSIKDQEFRRLKGSEGQTWNTSIIAHQLLIGQHDGASVLVNDSIQRISDTQGAWLFVKLNNTKYMLGGHYKGLNLYKNTGSNTSPHWKFQHHIKGFSESARVIVQEEGTKNTFWIAHAYKGLYRVTLNDRLNQAVHVKLYNADNGLPSNISNNVFKIKGKLVFSGEKGIFQYDHQKDTFLSDGYWNAIFGMNSTTNKLVEDRVGNVWFVVNQEVGQLKFSKTRNKLEKKIMLEKLHGKLMPGFEYIYPRQNGDVIFGSDEGFIYYTKSKENVPKKTFHTLLRKVTLTDQIDSVIFNGYLTNSDPVNLPAQMSNLKFNYAAIFYGSPEKTQYKYYLEGFENTWSKWSLNRQKEYTNLSHGKYIFHVKSKNIYGVAGRETSYAFQILPPWYLSNYAYIAYTILGITLLVSINTISKKTHAKEKEILKQNQRKALKKKEKEFDKIRKKKEREIIKLTNEKLAADIIHKNKELASTTMQVIHKNEFLIQLKDKLQELKNNVKTKNPYKELSTLIKSIDNDIVHDVNWKKFEVHFDETHEGFLGKIREKYPKLSPKDLKLCSYLRMNLTTKEIAPLMNISVRGVEIARYRLRKKLEIDNNKIDLIDFVLKI